jgi:hypothetical protein
MNLKVGDFFNALYYPLRDGDPVLTCTVLSIENNRILAKTVSTQWNFEFDTETGEAVMMDHRSFATRKIPSRLPLCKIQSVAQPPEEICEGLRSIDRKFRYDDPDETQGDMRLTPLEIEAICFLDDFYEKNPI